MVPLGLSHIFFSLNSEEEGIRSVIVLLQLEGRKIVTFIDSNGVQSNIINDSKRKYESNVIICWRGKTVIKETIHVLISTLTHKKWEK